VCAVLSGKLLELSRFGGVAGGIGGSGRYCGGVVGAGRDRYSTSARGGGGRGAARCKDGAAPRRTAPERILTAMAGTGASSSGAGAAVRKGGGEKTGDDRGVIADSVGLLSLSTPWSLAFARLLSSLAALAGCGGNANAELSDVLAALVAAARVSDFALAPVAALDSCRAASATIGAPRAASVAIVRAVPLLNVTVRAVLLLLLLLLSLTSFRLSRRCSLASLALDTRSLRRDWLLLLPASLSPSFRISR